MKTFQHIWENRPFFNDEHSDKEIAEYYFKKGQENPCPPVTIYDTILKEIERTRNIRQSKANKDPK